MYDTARNNAIEMIPRVERFLDDCIISVLVKKVYFGHIKNEVHILIDRGPVMTPNPCYNRIPAGVKVQVHFGAHGLYYLAICSYRVL